MSNFNIIDFIGKKKDNLELTKEEIYTFVDKVQKKEIPSYQISAWLMAVTLNGMTDEETYHLTMAMRDSGKTYNFDKFQNRVKIDKHSTGGIGDSVSLILLPIVVALGYSCAKLSGRGLGFTGGTLDKLASVGIRTDHSFEKAQAIHQKCGLVILAQTDDVAPADGTFYALRDITNTVMSIPLIASSIMSKKLALINDYLFLDVKYGSGAFCHNFEMAKDLSSAMLRIAKLAKFPTVIHITAMNEPLSSSIGNSIEVIEAINFLNNKPENKRIYELIVDIAVSVVTSIEPNVSKDDAITRIKKVIEDGSALKVFEDFAVAQGADINVIRSKSFFAPKHKMEIYSEKSGKASFKHCYKLGLISNKLGAGRMKKEDIIDFHAGIKLHFCLNDDIKKGQLLYTLYSSKPINSSIKDEILENTVFGKDIVKSEELLIHFED